MIALKFDTGHLWYELHGQAIHCAQVTDLINRIGRRAQRMPLTGVVLDNAMIHHHFDSENSMNGWTSTV